MASISHFFSLSLSLSLSLSFSLPLQLNYALHQLINAHTHSHHSLAIHYSFIQLLTEVFHTRVPCIKQLRKATSTSLSSCLSSSLSLSSMSPIPCPFWEAPQVSLSCSCMSLRSLRRFNQLPALTMCHAPSRHISAFAAGALWCDVLYYIHIL